MKNFLAHFCILLFVLYPLSHGGPLSPKKALSVDLKYRGFLIVSCDELDRKLRIPKPGVTYFISKINETYRIESITSKHGTVSVFALSPGEYQIREWTLSGTTQGTGLNTWNYEGSSDVPYKFTVIQGEATYIGRILTDLNYFGMNNQNIYPSNRPIILDRYGIDITAVHSKFKVLENMNINNFALEGFNWTEEEKTENQAVDAAAENAHLPDDDPSRSTSPDAEAMNEAAGVSP